MGKFLIFACGLLFTGLFSQAQNSPPEPVELQSVMQADINLVAQPYRAPGIYLVCSLKITDTPYVLHLVAAETPKATPAIQVPQPCLVPVFDYRNLPGHCMATSHNQLTRYLLRC